MSCLKGIECTEGVIFIAVHIAQRIVPRAGIFKQAMGARKRVGLGLSYQRQATQPGRIGSLESILGLLNSLKIRAPVAGLRIEPGN
jgi:hypothetical protein